MRFLSPLRSHAQRHVVGYIALAVAVSGGTAYGLSGHNTVFSDDIVDGRVKTQDIANESIRGADVKDESISEADVNALTTSEGLVRLAAGESQELFSEGPFTATLSCTLVDTTLTVEVVASSTDPDGMFTTPGGGSGPIPPDRQLVNADVEVPSPDGEMKMTPFALASSTGTVITGTVAAGVNSLGTECYGLAGAVDGSGSPPE